MLHGFIFVSDLSFTNTDSYSIHELLIQQMDVYESVQGSKFLHFSHNEIGLLRVDFVFFDAKVVKQFTFLWVLTWIYAVKRAKSLASCLF